MGQALPLTAPPSAAETMVEQALVKAQRLQRELAQLGAPPARTFATLTVAEQRAYLRGFRGQQRIASFSQAELIAYGRGIASRGMAA